jgi:peptidylprolyl isomerase/FKBP-type peptidyl-prolyl cis-trans isomerase FklB
MEIQIKKIKLYALLLLAVLPVACKDDNDGDDAWKTANEQAFNVIAANPEYTELPSLVNNGSLYYKVLKKGEGTKPIYYTSAVQIYYKAWYVAADPDKHIVPGTVCGQRLFDDGTPLAFLVNDSGLLEGWRTALQYMTQGDKWEIWVPQRLNYYIGGTYVSAIPSFLSAIPAYTTLACEIEVVNVWAVNE